MTATFTVEIDWDHNGTWTDETSRTRRAQIKSGFEQPGQAVAGAGRCILTMDNRDQRFSPGYLSSPLYGDLLPRRQVRVKASDGVTTWTLFRGFIDTIQPDAGQWGRGECLIECIDALALLARQRIGVAHEDNKAVDEAVSDVVAAAYTPPAASYSDNADTLTHYGRSWPPEETTCLDALREICEAVYGRFFIARDGTAVYLSRDDRQNSSLSAAMLIGDVEYWQRVKEIRPASLLAYWRLNESSGTTAADSSGNSHSAAVSGTTWGASGIGDGDTAASFDGVNDFINLYSTGLRDAFNGPAGTVMIWGRVANVGVWTDGMSHSLVRLVADGNNLVHLFKPSTSNYLEWRYTAGGTIKNYDLSGVSTLNYFVMAITWNKNAGANGEVKCYYNGVQVGSTLTGLGTWAGQLASTTACIGARDTTPTNPWAGILAHAALWNVALSANEIAQLSGV